MINILPEQGVSEVKKEYRFRLATVILFAGAAALLILAALLFPSYLFSRSSLQEVLVEEARIASLAKERNENTDVPLQRAKDEIEVFGPLLGKVPPSVRIEKLIGVTHTGVRITTITTDSLGKTAQLSGVASTRDALLTFLQSVRALPEVAAAELPVSDLAKSSSVPFSLAITLKDPSQKP